MSKTLRLVYPDWQSGNRTEYYDGAFFLKQLIPQNDEQKEVQVTVEHNNGDLLKKMVFMVNLKSSITSKKQKKY
ncbi:MULTISPECIES: hypothetical protein [unclassified Staphylococcus]|uniref:hypothetical protein n=1 Tax=unclassified Staphylococcus TaxID=91994 RepID=UPI0021D12613|nr:MULTISPECIES: hypothetical protein [unclassified Staphylococcus]UXR70085.1 hypothetical protein MUA26_02815 [Staphylococcus sp. IVB6246]UXR72145.1 hypothetical protein MUA88_02890 [Staphylococcus sp. IVB6240]UXR74453.1 hypothetical protein MUA48_03070 [Staphylococcus sp. IVB6238]UXR76838.1 hypothetical protein MUA74_03430 [Staphylococcus sp. IVB6233]UXR80965.1 hypothetical protein MUA65_03035 [Staphylococcus sp. IVB6218]